MEQIPAYFRSRMSFHLVNMHKHTWPLLLGMFVVSACSSTHYYAARSTGSALLEVTDQANPSLVSGPSSNLANYLQTYHDSLDRSMNQVLVQSAKYLKKGGVESELGDLLTDLFREQAQKRYGATIDLAHMNNGGIRAELPAGNITLRNVYEIMPFDNDLVVLTVSGETMRQFIEYLAARQDPQSGLKLVVDKETKKPLEIYVQGQPFDPQKTYRILVSDYVATGGDSAFFLKNSLKSEPLNYLMRDAIRDYFVSKGQQNQILNPQLDGRTTLR